MITRFKKIDNIGSFFYFDWENSNPALMLDKGGNPILDKNGVQKIVINKFNKFNVLFGENGAGKTTLVKLLKTLNSDIPSLISKNWDHEGDACSFDIETDSSDILYDDASGLQNNILKGKILIFDRDYIDSFVHSFPTGRAANHNKNTGNLILYLGNFFQYRNQLNNLSQCKRNLEDKNEQIKSKRSADFNALNSGGSYIDVKSAFDALTPVEIADITNNIQKQKEITNNIEKEITSINQKITKADEITRTNQPNNIDPITSILSSEVNSAFSFSVSVAAASAMSQVSGREDFIREGVKITHNYGLEDCPFCKQSIKKGEKYIEPIPQYEAIFNKTFIDEQEKTEKVLHSYKSKIISILGLKVPEGNSELVSQINKLLNEEDRVPDVVLSEAYKKSLESELENIEAKEADITKVLSSNVLIINAAIDEINGKINLYNRQIEIVKQKLLKAKSEISSGSLPEQNKTLQGRLSQEKLRLFVLEFYGNLSNIFPLDSVIKKNEQTIKKVGELFEILRKKVEELFRSFVNEYFSEIEKNLSVFCPSLELKMVGVSPRYDLRVGVSGDVTCGLEVHYKSHDRLKDLSEGERQSIALSYFLASLKKENNKKSKIVVFDDPINSFDAGRRKQAAELIYKEAVNFGQLFIFTCDSLFKSYCLKVCNKKLGDKRNFYYILKSASSSIHYRSKELMSVYSSFIKDFRNINSVTGTDDKIVEYGQKLRYCLEEIKDRHLGYSEDKFECILDKVQCGKIGALVEKIDDIRELYSYCNVGGLAHFPKDGQTSWSELKIQIDKYMKLGL